MNVGKFFLFILLSPKLMKYSVDNAKGKKSQIVDNKVQNNFFSFPNKFQSITDSWIELTNNLIQSCPDRVTPPLPFSSGEEYLRLLKEAQKESNPSSLIGSRQLSPKVGSPKSPPNSPNPEPSTNAEELKGVFINYYASKVKERSLISDVDELVEEERKYFFEHARVE